jgi:hypothetical protein
VDLAPGHVIADGDGGVENEAIFTRERGIIDDLAGENGGVGNDDFDVFDGADAGDEEAFGDDVSGGVADADPVAKAERAHVSDDDAGRDIAHR